MNRIILLKSIQSKIAIAMSVAVLIGATTEVQAQSYDRVLAQVHIMILDGEPGRIRKAIGYLTPEERTTLLDSAEYKNKRLHCFYDPNKKSGSCSANGNPISPFRYGSLSVPAVNAWIESEGGICREQRNGVPFGADIGARRQSSRICTIDLVCNNQNCKIPH